MTELQRTDEWFQARLGKVTASRISDLTAKTKSGYAATRANYMADLLCERLTGERKEGFTNAAMQWGTDMEPDARRMYEFMTDASVSEVGFVPHPRISAAGASPDGLIDTNGLIEIKCPNTATHIETLLGAPIDGKYVKQMQWQMACTGREWCDFVSYDPRLPERMQIHIRRVSLDRSLVADLEDEVDKFLAELAAKEKALRSKFEDDGQ